MRLFIQRVIQASVSIDKNCTAQIGKGLLILVSFEESDTEESLIWAGNKLLNLRIFNDEQGVMNLSVKDIMGELLIVSQFTLHAQIKKGNRPSYIRAARPNVAEPLYIKFIQWLNKNLPKPSQTGTFGADMQISLINDGPVSIWIDTNNKE
ncbi:MAG: D-aminoacyl-tRNA deacylase [Bacteroidales bacterium]